MASEIEKLINRNQYYKDGLHQMFTILLVSVLLNFTGLYILYYIYTHPPAPVYFPTSINGRISPLVPLDQPNKTEAEIKEWANTAIIASYTYNYVSYRTDLQAASEFFTPDGWTTFLNALKSSNNLQAIVANKFVVTGQAVQAPVILQKGVFASGRYSWRVQMPVVVTYQSSTLYSQSNYLVTMLIERVSTLNSVSGIGIVSIVSTTAGQSDADSGTQ